MNWLLSSFVIAALSLDVTPRIQLSQGQASKGQVYVKVTLRPDPSNRVVCVQVDGPTYRSSCWTVNGEHAQVREEWWVKGLDAGQYEARATVDRSDRTTVYSEAIRFCVAGESVESEC